MQALEIQGIKMQALLIAMHLFFSICGIQHALCFKNYCHYSASIFQSLIEYDETKKRWCRYEAFHKGSALACCMCVCNTAHLLQTFDFFLLRKSKCTI